MTVRRALLLFTTFVAAFAAACEGATGPGVAGGDGSGADVRDDGVFNLGDVATTDGSAPTDTAVPADIAPPTDTGRPPGPDTGPPSDTPVAQDAPVSRDTPVGGPAHGSVVAWEARSDFLDRAGVTAEFQRGASDPPPAYGTCAVLSFDPARPSPAPASLDAGTISVTGTSRPVTLTWSPALPGGGVGYASDLPEETERILGAPGTVATATGTGGRDVPAFTASVATPLSVSVDAPPDAPFGAVSRSEPLLVRWNAADGETTIVSLNVIDGSYKPAAGDALVCTLLGDSGQFTVPAAAMARLPTGPSYRVVVGVTRARTATVRVGTAEVSLTVTASAGVVPSLR